MKSSIFIIHHGALGDIVTAFPLFSALIKSGFEVELLCQNHLGVLALELGRIHKAHALESTVFSSLFQEHPNPMAADIINACDVVLALTRSDELVSRISRFFKKPIYRIRPRPEPQNRIHVSRHLLLSCAENGLIHTPEVFWNSVHDPDSAGLEQTDRIWIHPGAGSVMKRWPIENFIELAPLLKREGFDPAFLLGPAEVSLEPLLDKAAAPFQITSASELTQLIHLLKKGKGLIGNDSGVSHLAAFLGLSTVAVFGPTDPARWKPVGPSVAVVQGLEDCDPCFETEADGCREHACFNGVSAHRVVRAFIELKKPV